MVFINVEEDRCIVPRVPSSTDAKALAKATKEIFGNVLKSFLQAKNDSGVWDFFYIYWTEKSWIKLLLTSFEFMPPPSTVGGHPDEATKLPPSVSSVNWTERKQGTITPYLPLVQSQS